MAYIYVRSTDGNNGDSGATWALAKATAAGATAIDAAGDTVALSQVHSETTAAAITLAFAGVSTNFSYFLCVNDGAAPPTAMATGAIVAATGANNITVQGNLYCYGVEFRAGSAASNAYLILGASGNLQIYDTCTFYLVTTSTVSQIEPYNGGTTGRIEWRNCTVRFSHVSQNLLIASDLHWNGGGLHASGSAVSVILGTLYNAAGGTGGQVLIENVDLSSAVSTMSLTVPPTENWDVTFRNCRLPASWSGGVVSSGFSAPGRARMYNCDDGATNYAYWIEDFRGTIRDETTLVKTSGASDGTTAWSLKMVSTTNAAYPAALISEDLLVWNDTTGASKTVTVDILHDSATNLTDKEVWLDVSYLGSSSYPIGTPINDAAASVLATAADQAASSATWTTTGMSNPNKQQLSVTFTPQMKGLIRCRVCLAKASKTIYVDPVPQVS